jgi:hypothetical protein
MDRMFKNYQEVTPEEGFDKVVNQDNTSELKKLISDEKMDESKSELKHLKTYESFKTKKK